MRFGAWVTRGRRTGNLSRLARPFGAQLAGFDGRHFPSPRTSPWVTGQSSALRMSPHPMVRLRGLRKSKYISPANRGTHGQRSTFGRAPSHLANGQTDARRIGFLDQLPSDKFDDRRSRRIHWSQRPRASNNPYDGH